jgi:response regulator RpfG family c-di-GMP phosphodiesterase
LKRAKHKGEKAPSIVLVDDDQKVIELLQIALSSCGYRTFTASDGEDAVQLVEKVNPDVIVLDVRLPKKNGYQVCEAVKSNPKTQGIPIIMISGLVEPSARVQGLRCGAEDYLTKPFSPKELLLRIQKILLRVSETRSRAKMSAELERELMDRERRLGLAHHKLAKRVERVATLAETGRRMAGASSLEELSDQLIMSLQICLRVSTVLVAYRNPKEDEFCPLKYHGISGRRVQNVVIPVHGKLFERFVTERRVLTLDELDSVAGLREELLPLGAAGISMGILVDGLDGPVAMIFVGADLDGEGFGKEQREDLEALSRFFTTGLLCLQRGERERSSLVDTIENVINLLECDAPGRRGHSLRVAGYALSIAEALGMCPRDAQEMRLAALLHEIKGAGPTTPEFMNCACVDGGECSCSEDRAESEEVECSPTKDIAGLDGGDRTCSNGSAEPESGACGPSEDGAQSEDESLAEKQRCGRPDIRVHDGGSSTSPGQPVSLACQDKSENRTPSSIGHSSFPPNVVASLRHVRERYDGRGLPLGLCAEEIPLQARILAVADTFDDCLRHGWSSSPVDQAIKSLRGLSGTNLDPNIVEALVHHLLSGEIMLG